MASALADMSRYVLPDSVLDDYFSSYQGSRFAESVRYVRSYPACLPVLAGLLPEIQTPVAWRLRRHRIALRQPK